MAVPVLNYQANESRFGDVMRRLDQQGSIVRNSLYMLAFLGGTALVFAGSFGFAVLPGVLLVLTVALVLRSIRRRRGLAVLGYLDQAMRMNQPLPESLSAAADGEVRWLRRRLYSVRDALVGGVPVGTALEVCVPEIPQVTARTIGAAEKLGVVAPILRSIVQREQVRRESIGDQWILMRFYPVAVLGTGIMIVWMLCTFVTPKFDRIFRDFRVSSGPWLKGLVYFGDYVLPAALVVLGCVIWLYVALRLWEIFLPHRRRSAWQGPVDWLAWYVPPARGYTQAACLASAMQMLASGVAAGFRLPDAVLQALQVRQNEVFSGRLEEWHRAMLAGESMADAARRARLPKLVVGMLNCPGASLADTLRFLSLHYSDRFSRCASVLRGAVVPGLTLLFGCGVLVVAMGLFDPIVRLIKAVLPMGGFNL